MTKQEFLAMSLPYGLVGITQDQIVKINGINYENQLPIIWDSINKKKSDFRGVCGFGIMPILHPLSDLTKEIEHKGETFVPIEKLNEMFGYEKCKLVYYINSGLGWGIDSGFCSTAITFSDMYLPIQKLLEWKFDIADLISRGEAIDVNILNINPYK